MKKRIVTMLAALCLALLSLAQPARAGSNHRLGAGVNYWKTINNVNVTNVDENGLSYLVTYQYVPSMLLRLEADLEIFPQDFTGGSGLVWAPQGFVMTGIGPLYAGVGIGIYYDGSFAAAPFYMARAGYEFQLVPQIFIDLNINYRVDDWSKIRHLGENIHTDTIRLGAAARIGF